MIFDMIRQVDIVVEKKVMDALKKMLPQRKTNLQFYHRIALMVSYHEKMKFELSHGCRTIV